MRELPSSKTRVDLIARSGFDAIKASFLDDRAKAVVRTGASLIRPVPGELFTVEVEKSWIFGKTPYLSGEVVDVRLDVHGLGLEPLKLFDMGPHPFDPDDLDHLPKDLATELQRSAPLTAYEMEWIMPGFDPGAFQEDPIVEAAELGQMGRVGEAQDILSNLLAEDLRCLDAHAHLGTLLFEYTEDFLRAQAERHYRVGVAIGDLSLPEGKPFLLPYPMINNRPYLRCLHGLGLCRWRAGDFAEAERIFRRGLFLNPNDNQGLRFLLEDLKHGRSWEETGY